MDLAVFATTAMKKLAPRTDALEYYDAHVGEYADIFRLIITHPHMDHITGMHRLIYQEPKDIGTYFRPGSLIRGRTPSRRSRHVALGVSESLCDLGRVRSLPVSSRVCPEAPAAALSGTLASAFPR